MARRDPSFTDVDVLRFIEKNLSDLERDKAICKILILTGSLKANPTITSLLSDIKLIFTGLTGILTVAGRAIAELGAAGRYNAAF